MISISKMVVALAAAGALVLGVSAQQAAHSNQQSTQGMRGMSGMQGMQQGQMGGQGMMQSQKNMHALTESNERVQKQVEAAWQSNDPAKMRAALDTADKALGQVNENMKTCMNMMDMMQNMQGMAGGGMMGGQQTEPQTQKPPKQ